MKLLLEIQDNKVEFIKELLSNFSFVEAKSIDNDKFKFLEGLQESVGQVNSYKDGKAELKPARQLLDEI
jgi:hypothetical protein